MQTNNSFKSSQEDWRPIIATMIGDPCGIGPEVTVKCWVTGKVHESSRPVLIGSAVAVEQALQASRARATVRRIRSPDEIADRVDTIDVIDSGILNPDEITIGKDSAACGRATGLWIDEADALARSGKVGGVVMGSISSSAMKMGGVLDRVITDEFGDEFLVLIAGALRVVHVTDHVPLERVCAELDARLVLNAISTVHDTFARWGIESPRIGVAGLNPHAVGRIEEVQIGPAVSQARARGIFAEGPISPDTVFRQCIEGRYDVVVAMFHDQGHIAVKTWGFSGNCATTIGRRRPYLFMGTAHGTAYDIAGRGIADHSMMLSAMTLAGSLAGGRGFPELQVREKS